MTLYKDSSEVLSIVFNATDTSNEDWFSKKRLVHSPWTDLEREQENYFSVQGALHMDVPRVFYINRFHCNCNCDAGWLMVSYTSSHCGYERRHPQPIIVYSKSDTFTKWSNYGKKTEETTTTATAFVVDKCRNKQLTKADAAVLTICECLGVVSYTIFSPLICCQFRLTKDWTRSRWVGRVGSAKVPCVTDRKPAPWLNPLSPGSAIKRLLGACTSLSIFLHLLLLNEENDGTFSTSHRVYRKKNHWNLLLFHKRQLLYKRNWKSL